MAAIQCGLVATFLVVAVVCCCIVDGQAQLEIQDEQLHAGDYQALRAIRASLADLPGSFFFDSWVVVMQADDPVYPCTSFMGVLCDYVQGVLRVRELNLGTDLADSPGLTGTLHPAIGSLTALQQLTLSPGQVGGSLPPSLGALQHLQFLGISKNRISGSIPASLAALQALQTLDLSYNKLCGTLPASLLQLPNLQALLISHNRLAGRLPSTISSPLLHLDMQGNLLSGPLPPTLPPTLSFLSLANNRLSENISALSRPLPSLYYVNLSFNKLTGVLPPSLLGIPLHSLLLQHNYLWGLVDPLSHVSMGTLDLSFNEFSGPLSPLLATASSLYLNNNRFTGRVPRAFADQLLAGDMVNLYLQHNLVTQFQLDPFIPLPIEASLCISFNCMETPTQSHCPDSVATETNSPDNQCGH
ncbi:hypothetical protein L7F22_033907 [Adiantum nelumboides]|nr:hypothetical protein [Adiantum nelumboides]